MRSFNFERFVEQAYLKLETLEYTRTISTPGDKRLMATHRVKEGSVTEFEWDLDATLIVLSMQDFNVILRRIGGRELWSYWLGNYMVTFIGELWV